MIVETDNLVSIANYVNKQMGTNKFGRPISKTNVYEAIEREKYRGVKAPFRWMEIDGLHFIVKEKPSEDEPA